MRRGCAIAFGVVSTLFVVLFPSVIFPMIMIFRSHHISPSCKLNNLTLAAGASVVYYAVALTNEDNNRGVYFDAINVTFRRGAVNASATVDGFYQPIGATTPLGGRLGFSGRRSLTLADGYVRFGVELKTAVRYRNFLTEEKGVYEVELGADVEVNGDGELVKDEGEDDGVEFTQIHFGLNQA